MPRGYPSITPPAHGTHHRYCTGCRCAACREGHRRYGVIRDLARTDGPLTVDSTVTSRKLQALVALGWSYPQLAARLGVRGPRVGHLVRRMHAKVTTDTAAQVDAIYRDLHMKTPPTGTQQERYAVARAKIAARKSGWVPPLAYDDIDDPNEVPTRGERSKGRGVDLDEWLFLVRGGEDPERAANRMGVTLFAIEAQARRKDRPDVHALTAEAIGRIKYAQELERKSA